MAGKPVAERFERMVDRSGDHHRWNGACRPDNGTGRLKIAGREVAAHRVACELVHGPVPPNARVLPCGDDPACVRPDGSWSAFGALEGAVGELERVRPGGRGDDPGETGGEHAAEHEGGRHPLTQAERARHQLADGVAPPGPTHLLAQLRWSLPSSRVNGARIGLVIGSLASTRRAVPVDLRRVAARPHTGARGQGRVEVVGSWPSRPWATARMVRSNRS
jgi:hypothetical protein